MATAGLVATASSAVADPAGSYPLIDFFTDDPYVEAYSPAGAALGYTVHAYDELDHEVPVTCTPRPDVVLPVGK